MEERKLKKLKDELDALLGDGEKELLKDVVLMLHKQDNNLSRAVEAIEASDLSKVQKKQFKVLTEAVSKIKLNIPKKQIVDVKNLKDIKFPKEIKVNNFKEVVKAIKAIKIPEQKEMPKEMRINNLKDIPKPLKEIDIKKPKWLKQVSAEEWAELLSKLVLQIQNGRLRVDLDKYINPKRPLAVRMSNGKEFVSAMRGIVSDISRGMTFPFKTVLGVAKEALVDHRGHQQVDMELADSPSIDAFGRLRTAEPKTLFDSKQIFDNAPLFWDDSQVSGGSTTSAHSVNTASTVIGVALNTAGRRIRQTFMRFNYQPGKSQLVFMTGTLGNGGGGAGITRSMGIYDDNNGILMKDDEGVVTAVIRSKATGSVVDNEVVQADWNLDKLNGKGGLVNPSGITLDPTKSQITITDFEWLGVGRVRIGFVFAGIPVYVHEFNHSNVEAGVYMSTPNLPLRYEIENDGTGVASTLEHICSSIISEGGSERLGILRHKDSGAITGLSAGTTYAVIGLKLQAAKLGGIVELEDISILSTTQNDQAHWSIRFNPTVAGTFTYSNEENSVVMSATGAVGNTVTGGLKVDGGYFSTAQAAIASIPNALRIGASIANTVDTIVLCVTPITNNIAIQSSETWRELS